MWLAYRKAHKPLIYQSKNVQLDCNRNKKTRHSIGHYFHFTRAVAATVSKPHASTFCHLVQWLQPTFNLLLMDTCQLHMVHGLLLAICTDLARPHLCRFVSLDLSRRLKSGCWIAGLVTVVKLTKPHVMTEISCWWPTSVSASTQVAYPSWYAQGLQLCD